MNKNIAKDEMIVTLKEAAKEEWSEFTEKLQEAFAVAVEEKYGPLNGEKLPLGCRNGSCFKCTKNGSLPHNVG